MSIHFLSAACREPWDCSSSKACLIWQVLGYCKLSHFKVTAFCLHFVFAWNLIPVHILPVVYHIRAKWEWTAVWIIFCTVIIHRHKAAIKFPEHNNFDSSPITVSLVWYALVYVISNFFLLSYPTASSLCSPSDRNHVYLELISHCHAVNPYHYPAKLKAAEMMFQYLIFRIWKTSAQMYLKWKAIQISQCFFDRYWVGKKYTRDEYL